MQSWVRVCRIFTFCKIPFAHSLRRRYDSIILQYVSLVLTIYTLDVYNSLYVYCFRAGQSRGSCVINLFASISELPSLQRIVAGGWVVQYANTFPHFHRPRLLLSVTRWINISEILHSLHPYVMQFTNLYANWLCNSFLQICIANSEHYILQLQVLFFIYFLCLTE